MDNISEKRYFVLVILKLVILWLWIGGIFSL